jgi:hypothetical protein
MVHVMPNSDPYLSVVVTSRNDNHGGTLLRRMQTFVNALIAQCKQHDLRAELIIVEWNPPADRPPLIEALRWPQDTSPCDVRVIQVPPELHRRYKYADALPLYQMIAKNVGIRRARGAYIVATNIDILLSDELVQFIAERRLQHGRMYRIDRHDVMTDVPVDAPVEEQLDYCRTHLLRLNARDGTFPVTLDGQLTVGADDIAGPQSGMVFSKAWYGVERKPAGVAFSRAWYGVERDYRGESFRWVGDDAVLIVQTPVGRPRTLCLELEPGPGVDFRPFELQVRDANGQIAARGMIDGRRLIQLSLPFTASQFHSFHLRTICGGQQVAGDPRVMNFRVFRCYWSGRVHSAAPPADDPALPYNFRSRFPSLTARIRSSPVTRKLWQAARRWFPATAGPTRHLQFRLGRGGRDSDIAPLHLHTNGCGDFTLMAREHWFDLAGYPELDLFSLHLDSLFCFMAHHGGAIEEVLTDPMRIYHIEHSAGSGWTPEGADKLIERISAKGIACLDMQEVLDHAADMRRHNRPVIFNGPDWGLVNDRLPEMTLSVAAGKAA